MCLRERVRSTIFDLLMELHDDDAYLGVSACLALSLAIMELQDDYADAICEATLRKDLE